MILVIPIYVSLGQNLVHNSGFEDFHVCPTGYNVSSEEELIPYWRIPTSGTSDYYNRCNKTGRAGVPLNSMGYMEAMDGDGYTGIILSDLKEAGIQNNYREYLQTQLKEKLEKGEQYCVQFYFSIASLSRFSVNKLGVYLSEEAPTSESKLLPLIPQLMVDTSMTYNQKDIWMKFCGVYTAQGNESFLTIGNFHDDRHTQLFDFLTYKGAQSGYALSKLEDYAYYYIDKVSVMRSPLHCCDDTYSTKSFPSPDPIETGIPYILQQVYFDFNKHSISTASDKTLQLFVQLLQKHPQWIIEIKGHTDSIGSYAYNQQLSLHRAKAIVNYLKENGIENELRYTGYSYQQPIYSNKTPFGRSKNRRVEFMVLNNAN